MRKGFISFITFLISMLMIIGCSDNGADSDDNNDFIWPLALGNWWDTDVSRLEIDSSFEAHGTTFYRIPDYTTMGYVDDFLCYLDDQNVVRKVLPNNPSLNDTWTRTSSDTAILEVVDIRDITVPAGTFKSFEVTEENVPGSWFFSMNIGFIKGDGAELIDYHIE